MSYFKKKSVERLKKCRKKRKMRDYKIRRYKNPKSKARAQTH